MEHSMNGFGISNMANDDNWLPIQYGPRTTSKKCDSEEARRSVKTQTNSGNRSVSKTKLPRFNFPGPQTGSEKSPAPSTRKQACKCKCSSGEPISFVQAYRKRMQYERLGIPITVEEVLSLKRFNSQNSSQVKGKNLERFHDSSTQTDLIQYLDNSSKEPNNTGNIDDEDINIKSDHSDSEVKKCFTASKEKEHTKGYRDNGGQEYCKNSTRTRPSNSSVKSSSSDEFERSRGSERKSGSTQRSFSAQTERNSRIRSSDVKKSNYLNHSLRRSSAKYYSDENTVSDHKSNDDILPHFNTQTRRASSTQSKNRNCSWESKKSKNFYGGGPSESDDMRFLSYSNNETKRAPSRQSQNRLYACESTKANYQYCGPDPESDDIQISRHSNDQTKRASSFQSKSKHKFKSKSCSRKSSKDYHVSDDPDPNSEDSPFMPSSRNQTNRFTSYQPKFRKYSHESTNANHFTGGSDPKSDDALFTPYTKSQTKRVTSYQPKFGKYLRDPTIDYQYIGRTDSKFDDTSLFMPHSKVSSKHATSYQPKYRANSCDLTKAKYLNRCQERKSVDFQPKRSSSKYSRSKIWNCTESSNEESKPSDSSEPIHSKFYREAYANQKKFDKSMLQILKKHDRKTTPRYPYEEILESLKMDDHRPSFPQKRDYKHNCFRNPTKERYSHHRYSPRKCGKFDQNCKGSGTFLYNPSLNIIQRQTSSHRCSSVKPHHCKFNDALTDSLSLKSSGTVTDVWHKEILTHESEISFQSYDSDDRLSGGLLEKRLLLNSKTFNLKNSSRSKYKKQYIGHWDELLHSEKRKTVTKRLTLLREFQYFAEMNFKRSNMSTDFTWHRINAIEINSRLSKCPVGSRTCKPILNESLLSHFINQHLNEPGIELREMFERDRLLLVFNAKALELGKNACMSVLTYGGFRGQSDSKPALRFMPVLNSNLPWPFEKFRGYLPLMLMICRTKRNILQKSSYSYNYHNSSRSRKRVHFQDEDEDEDEDENDRQVNNTDEDVIVLWVASLELPQPLYIMLTVFDQAMATTRTSIVKVRSIMQSQDVSDFETSDETHMLLPAADIQLLSNYKGEAIYLELSIHEYFYNNPCA